VIYDAQCAHPCQPFAFQHLPHSTAARPTFIAIPLLLRRYTARRLLSQVVEAVDTRCEGATRPTGAGAVP
jgi:hypothetical protein